MSGIICIILGILQLCNPNPPITTRPVPVPTTITSSIGPLPTTSITSSIGPLPTTSITSSIGPLPTPIGPSPVFLGFATNYAVLAQSGVSTVPQSHITGDIGLSPASATFLTGFSITKAATGLSASSNQVTGSLFAADFTTPTPLNLNNAVGSMIAAYNDASGRVNPTALNLGAGGIGGLTLTPGLYKWTSAVNIATDLTLSGTPVDTWIFQVAGGLSTASSSKIILTGGALAQNIVWAVADTVRIGSGAHFEGIILGKTSVTLLSGATHNGRILCQTAATLQQATVTQPI